MQKIAGFVIVAALSCTALSGVAIAVTDAATSAAHPRDAHVRADGAGTTGGTGTVPTPKPSPTDPTGPANPDTWGWG